MAGDFLKPKAHNRESLFRARTEEFQFRNPLGNEFTMRGRIPQLPSGSARDPQISVNRIKGSGSEQASGRNKTYEKMFGTQIGGMHVKGRPL